MYMWLGLCVWNHVHNSRSSLKKYLQKIQNIQILIHDTDGLTYISRSNAMWDVVIGEQRQAAGEQRAAGVSR